MNSRFRDDGPPQKRFRNDRSDAAGSRAGRVDELMSRGGADDDRFQSSGRGGGSRSFDKGDGESRHNTSPSRVLHVRGLRDYATQNDVVDAVKQFGRVTYVMMIPRNRQALVEFETVEMAKMVVRYSESSAIYVCGQPAFFNFSTSDSIKRPDGMPDFDQGMGGGSGQMGMDNKILVIVVQNPKYPITVDVMHTICTPHGDVLRIMITRKQSVTALVEFDNFDSARKAKQALNGCDVYSGCCTLKIDFAGPDLTRLNVMKNDKDTFDYTNPNPGANMPASRGALLGDGPPSGFGNGSSGWDDGGNMNNFNNSQGGGYFNDSFGNRGGGGGGMNNDGPFNGPGGGGGFGNRGGNDMGNMGGGGMGNMGGGGNFNSGGFGGGRGGMNNMGGGRGDSGGRGGFHGRGGFQGGRGGGRGGNMGGGPMGMGGGMGGPGNNGPMPGSVLLVYGLASGKFTCDKLFNLFCLYGNVAGVKILRTKEGGAMVNMFDQGACERAVMNLNHAYFFDSKLSVIFSKQDFVKIHPSPNELDDGTPSAKDFSGDRNNRFYSPEMLDKTRFSPPTKVLHFFNVPPSFTEDEMMETIKKTGTPAPNRVRIFPVKTGARSCSGLIEFNSVSDASSAIVMANHSQIPHPAGKMPYSLKLSFSASPIIDRLGRSRDGERREEKS